MAIPTYTKSGTKATTAASLPTEVFGVAPENHQLLKDAYLAYLANGRRNLAVTKTRGLIRGGGKKPWRQKGTGRARFGSSRNPIWRGGGIVFGPTGNENYQRQLSAKQKKLALRQALSVAADDKKIVVIESFDNKDAKVIKTQDFMNKIDAHGSVLLVVETVDALIKRATGNIPDLKVVSSAYLSVYDVINADKIVLSTDSLTAIKTRLEDKK